MLFNMNTPIIEESNFSLFMVESARNDNKLFETMIECCSEATILSEAATNKVFSGIAKIFKAIKTFVLKMVDRFSSIVNRNYPDKIIVSRFRYYIRRGVDFDNVDIKWRKTVDYNIGKDVFSYRFSAAEIENYVYGNKTIDFGTVVKTFTGLEGINSVDDVKDKVEKSMFIGQETLDCKVYNIEMSTTDLAKHFSNLIDNIDKYAKRSKYFIKQVDEIIRYFDRQAQDKIINAENAKNMHMVAQYLKDFIITFHNTYYQCYRFDYNQCRNAIVKCIKYAESPTPVSEGCSVEFHPDDVDDLIDYSVDEDEDLRSISMPGTDKLCNVVAAVDDIFNYFT